MAVIGGWIFFSFLYFKISFEAVYSGGINVLPSALLSIVTGGVVFFASAFYATSLGKDSARLLLRGKSNVVKSTLLTFLLAEAVAIVISKLIIFGFDKHLNRQLGGDVFLSFRRHYGEESIWFIALVCVPIAIHYGIVCFAGISNTNRLRRAYDHREGSDDPRV